MEYIKALKPLSTPPGTSRVILSSPFYKGGKDDVKVT